MEPETKRYQKGQKVQAVDETGRWENGTIREVTKDGIYIVSFDGWSTIFDVEIGPDNSEEIRDRIAPGSGEYQLFV